MARARPIFHLHIRKAAGSSLRKFMANKFPVAACLNHDDLRTTRDPAAFQLVSGHADFDYVKRFAVVPRIVTALRDPLDRALSAYYFARSDKIAKKVQSLAAKRSLVRKVLDHVGQPNRWQRVHEAARAYDLEEMIRREPELSREEFSNVQAHALAGGGPFSSEDELLSAARRNLESCDVVLLTERMDESLGVLCRTLGWDGEPRLFEHNITKERAGVESLSPSLRATLEEMNRADIGLYQHAVRLFEQRLATLPAPRREADVWPVPNAATFTFDQPIRGSGWSAREAADGEWFAWTGPETRLYLQSRSSGTHGCRLRVRAAVSDKALRDMQVQVNGTPLLLRQEGPALPCDFTGMLPRGLVRRTEPLELVVRPGEVRLSSELDPAAVDRRWLGLAISGVSLTPVGSAIGSWLHDCKEKLKPVNLTRGPIRPQPRAGA